MLMTAIGLGYGIFARGLTMSITWLELYVVLVGLIIVLLIAAAVDTLRAIRKNLEGADSQGDDGVKPQSLAR
jgi:hypothetical protein